VSLQNLLKIGQLKEHPEDAEEIDRLLSAAQRSVAEAQHLLADAKTWLQAHRPHLTRHKS
jgi:hypothetical protein